MRPAALHAADELSGPLSTPAALASPTPGAGITGLWRVQPDPAAGMLAGFLGSPQLFTLTQSGGTLTGVTEGMGGFFGGDGSPVPITEGSVNGDRVQFKSGMNTFEGKISGDQLERSFNIPFIRSTPTPEANPPAIGPAPDGSDSSIDFSGMSRSALSVVLKRSER